MRKKTAHAPLLLQSVADLLFPRKCPVCHGRLHLSEEALCLNCFSRLPFTLYHRWRGNPLEQRFYGTVPVERATSYLFYSPESPAHHILHQIKYYNNKGLAIHMGRCMGIHLLSEEGDRFLDGIDYLLPIPLARNRLRQRGYNQSLLLAEGISRATGIPLAPDSVVRTVDNPTQTRLNSLERWENVKGIFEATPLARKTLSGRHILLIDDVTTTGATLLSCTSAIHKAVPECRISIATLALAAL